MRKRRMIFRNILRGERASPLILVFFLLTVFLAVGAAFMLLVTSEARMVERQRLAASALSVAEAGLARGFYDLVQDFQDDSAFYPWMSGQINGIDVAFTNNTDYHILRGDVAFAGGTYTVAVRMAASSRVWLKSTGRVNGTESVVEAFVRIDNMSPWDNAIFAGGGQSGNLINGNVDIRGSVLVLGEKIDENGNLVKLLPTDYAIDLGGTAEIVGNNYKIMPADLKALVPDLEKIFYNGEYVESLSAELRVKNGMVGISGSSLVGEADVSGNDYKETVDGVYVGSGGDDFFGGNQGVLGVFSDNGTSEGYDLGDSMTFPRLSEPYKGYNTYSEYLDDNSSSVSAADLNFSGTFSETGDKGSITWDGTNLTINGIVRVDGNLTLPKEVSSVTYTGKGTLYVTGDVKVNTNLVTPTDAGGPTFPDNIIGIVTPKSMELGGTAQLKIMGMFYGENQITIDKQTYIAGSIVSHYFDMGTNVPKIFYVPEASRHLPPGLPGGDRIRICHMSAWMKG